MINSLKNKNKFNFKDVVYFHNNVNYLKIIIFLRYMYLYKVYNPNHKNLRFFKL